MKIAHLADIHIRPYKYLDEMRYTFERLYETLDEKKPDLIVICGDIFHSKLTVSSEYFQIVSKFFKELASRAELIVIPGNHDMALGNHHRLDAITPVVEAIQESVDNKITYSKASECCWKKNNVKFYHFSILDEKNKWPTDQWIDDKDINIALYHGSINGCKLDNGWISRGNKDSLEIFYGFDYAFLGDIHIQQFLSPTIAYPGSLRQNNYGESVDKGYLLWNIRGKEDFDVERVTLPQKRYFFTIYGSTIEDINIGELPSDCRIRLQLTEDIDYTQQIKLKSEIEKLYKPCNDVSVLPPKDEKLDIGNIKVGNIDILHENIRQPEIQKQLLKEFFKEKLNKKDIEDLIEIDKKYHSYIDTDVERNIRYNLGIMKWSNTFSYGKDNIINFPKLKGLVGIFAPNATGKSALMDTLSLGIFNQVFREGANKSVDYVNRKCKNASIEIPIIMNNKEFLVKRTFKKRSTKKGEDKCDTDINFYEINKKEKIQLNGEDKPGTNKNIRNKFGSDEDFSYLSLCSQFGVTKFIDARGTEKKKIFSKYFDLDIFDTKFQIAKKDSDLLKGKLSNLNFSEIEKNILEFEQELDKIKIELIKKDQIKIEYEEKISNLELEIKQLFSNLQKTEFLWDDIIIIRSQISSIKKELEKKNNQLKIYKSQICSFSEQRTKEELIEKQTELNKKISKIETELNLKINKLQEDLRTCELLKTIPDVPQCKICPLAKHAYEAREDIFVKDEKIKGLYHSLNELKNIKNKENYFEAISNIEVYEKTKSKIKFLELEIQNLEKDLEKTIENEQKFKNNEKIIEQNKNITKEIKEKENNISILKSSLSSHNKEIIVLNTNIAVLEQKIKDNKNCLQKCEQYSRQKYLYDLYLDAVGKNGISYWIISKKIPIVNKQVNLILSNCVDFRLSIEENLEEKSIKIYIQDEKGKRPIELGSGAEKTISSIALRAALWNICLLPKTPILILDEAFSYLDASKTNGVIKLLSYLKTYFKTIFVITHDESLKMLMDDSYTINKEKGFACLKIN